MTVLCVNLSLCPAHYGFGQGLGTSRDLRNWLKLGHVAGHVFIIIQIGGGANRARQLLLAVDRWGSRAFVLRLSSFVDLHSRKASNCGRSEYFRACTLMRSSR